MEDMNASLLIPVSLEDIKDAVFQMGKLKAPGLDGFQGVFYQPFWDNLMADVNGIVQGFM